MQWTIKKNITASLLAALAMMIVMGWICYRSTEGLITNNRWVEHTHEVVDTLDDFQQDLAVEAEDQSSFLNTGDEQYLNSYRKAQSHLISQLKSVKSLTIDNAHQQLRLETLESLISERAVLFDEIVTSHRDRGTDAAQDIRTKRSRQLTADITDILNAMEQEERDLLVLRVARAEASAKYAVLMLFGGILVSAGLLLTVFYFLNRQMLVRAQSEESLRQNEERFQLVARATKDGIWDWQLLTNELWWNDNFPRMFGYGVDELEKSVETWANRLHPDEAENIKQTLAQALESGAQTWLREYRFRRRDGSYAVVSDRAYIKRDDTGQPVRMIGSVTDISESKKAEDALSESEKRYRELVENSQGLICVHDLDGILLSVNPAAALTLGFTSDEMVGRNLVEFIAPSERPVFSHYLRRIETEPSINGLMNICAKGGEEHVWQYRNARVEEHGMKPYVLGHAQDITESKRMEEAHRESEERFRLLVEGVHDYAVLMLDADGLVSSWNYGAEKIKGYKAGEIIGKHFRCFYTPEDQQKKHPERELEIATAEGRYEEEGWRVRKDGTTFWANVVLTALYDASGKLRGFSKVTRDITERKRMEEELMQARDAALESVRLKSEFLANMSHEIRTPMNGVIGMTGLLLDTELSADQRDFAETIRQSGDSLLTIINDILDFSKIEAGKLQFETLDFNLTHAVEGTVELLAERAGGKRIELASLIHSDVPVELRGDPGRLRQVLTNLIGNAIKFTEAGEVIVRAEKQSETEERVVIRFTVRDTGIGISEAAQRKLFQAFTQADGSTTRKFGGTGLGLAISKQLVELMGGEIGITSETGQGSTFWFTAGYDKQPFKIIHAQPNVTSLDKLRVLIVDDNATNRKILSHQLGSWGMVHTEADSGRRALELLREAVAQGAAYDLAVLDLMMPEMDGFELAHTIKSDDRIAGTQLVLLTSFGQRGHGATAREAGVAAYLTKPVRQSQLFDCLTTVIGHTSLTAESDISSTRATSELLTKHTLQETKIMTNKLILLAEDNIVNQKVAVRQLQKLGYRADSVANGREAVEALGRISYDLVLMDCQMPEMDGYEATAEIRLREGTTKHTLIVAMTANALEGDRERCLAAGMDDYVSKPVKPEELGAVLDRLLSTAHKSVDAGAGMTPEVSLPVDMERLHLAMGDEPDELADILAVYLSQMSESLEKLDIAIESGNAAEVDMITHNCIGVSANCGMIAMVEPLKELERMGRDNQLVGAAIVSAHVSREFERVKLFLEDNCLSVRPLR